LVAIWGPGLADISSTWVTWWDKDGKKIWEGTGEELVTIFSKYLGMSIEEFELYWKDIQKIHREYGDGLSRETAIMWAKINREVVDSLDVMDKSLPPKMALIESRFHTSYSNLATNTKESLGELMTNYNNYFRELNDTELPSGLSDIETQFDTSYANLERSTEESLDNIQTTIVTTLDETEGPAINEVNQIQESIVEEFKKSEQPIKETIELWDDMILDEKHNIVTAAKKVATEAIDAMNEIFKNFKPVIDVKVNIPHIDAPTVTANVEIPTVPPYVGKGPLAVAGRAQYGAVVDKDQIIRVGEHGTKEMIAPLNEQSLAPFANMLADLINNRTETATPNVANEYVIVPLDRRGLINLERELFMIRKSEGKRRADY